jgi:hypothetical protein
MSQLTKFPTTTRERVINLQHLASDNDSTFKLGRLIVNQRVLAEFADDQVLGMLREHLLAAEDNDDAYKSKFGVTSLHFADPYYAVFVRTTFGAYNLTEVGYTHF